MMGPRNTRKARNNDGRSTFELPGYVASIGVFRVVRGQTKKALEVFPNALDLKGLWFYAVVSRPSFSLR